MAKRITPVTVFCADRLEAVDQASLDPDSRAMIGVPGTLNFHHLIAAHGAGEFTTLYVPLALKGTFMPPAGGEVRLSKRAGNCARPSTPEKGIEMTMNAEMEHFLKQAPHTVEDLARLLGKSSSGVRKTLKAHSDIVQTRKNGNGAAVFWIPDAPVPDSKAQGGVSAEKRPSPTEEVEEAVPAPPLPGEKGSQRVGRKTSAQGKRLTATLPTEFNPRRIGSHGFRSMQIIMDNPGITTEEYLAKGGRTKDLRWDISMGHVRAD